MHQTFGQIVGVFLLMAVVLGLAGCNGTTIGNGKIDPVEAATIRVAVGAAMSAKPSAIPPAYAVSTALLALTDPEQGKFVTVALIKDAIAKETAKLKLDPYTAASFGDLVGIIETKLAERLQQADIHPSERVIVIRAVIAIVAEAAAARMQPPDK